MASSKREIPTRLVGFDPAAITTSIDRTHSKRTVPMKVLCLGLSRTGTSSLRQALFDLGISDVYHFTSVVSENPPDAHLWIKALEAKLNQSGPEFQREEWDALLGHCMAVADHPCLTFTDELMETYPEAKVILTVRDSVDIWYESVLGTIWRFIEIRISPDVSVLRKIWRTLLDRGPFDHMTELIHFNPDGMYWEFPSNGKAFYEAHNEKIRQRVPKDRLLEFNVKEGWGPLCDFLEYEVPDWEFPRVNDRAEFNRYQEGFGRAQNWIVFKNTIKYALPVIATVGVGWFAFIRRR